MPDVPRPCSTALASRPLSSIFCSSSCPSLRRAVALVQAVSGVRLSEAICLGHVRRLHDALASWKEAVVAHLLQGPGLHVDETGLRIDGRSPWLHVVTDGTPRCKVPHQGAWGLLAASQLVVTESSAGDPVAAPAGSEAQGSVERLAVSPDIERLVRALFERGAVSPIS